MFNNAERVQLKQMTVVTATNVCKASFASSQFTGKIVEVKVLLPLWCTIFEWDFSQPHVASNVHTLWCTAVVAC